MNKEEANNIYNNSDYYVTWDLVNKSVIISFDIPNGKISASYTFKDILALAEQIKKLEKLK